MQNQVTNVQSKSKIPTSQNFFTTLLNLLDTPQNNNIIQAEPKIEVSENKENVMVTAEIPGISEKDIELEISTNGYLTISGEKKHEHTKYSTNGGYFSEISFILPQTIGLLIKYTTKQILNQLQIDYR